MKVKGYIDVNAVSVGLEATSVRQQIRVDCIDVVMDAGALTAGDRQLLQIEPQTQTLLICPRVNSRPCEVEDTYEEVVARIKEASE